MAITTDNLCVLCKEPLGHIEGNVHGQCLEGYLTSRYKDKMSWQEEYVARYEAGLREKWANNGKLIWRPGDDMPSNIREVVIPGGTYMSVPDLKGLKITMPKTNKDNYSTE